MKKLNRKGFTLVELLAVIIILAIVVGITIPAVLTTTNNARKKAFDTAAQSAADWFDRQYQVLITGLNGTGIATLDANFTTVCGNDASSCTATTGTDLTEVGLAAAGLKASNFSTTSGDNKVYINANGRSCIKLKAASSGGDYPNGTVTCGGSCTTTQCTSTNN